MHKSYYPMDFGRVTPQMWYKIVIKISIYDVSNL